MLGISIATFNEVHLSTFLDVALISLLTTDFPSDQISTIIKKNMQLRSLANGYKWLAWHCSISVNKTSPFLKRGHFLNWTIHQNWSIVWDSDFSHTRWEVFCPFSLPPPCNIAAFYSSDTAWKISSQLNNLYQLPPLPGSVLHWGHRIVLRGIKNPLICVHSHTVAWPRALGCLIFFANERVTEYRRWKGEITAAAAVGGKHDPSRVVFSPLSGTDNPTMQRKGSAVGKGMVPPHWDTIVFSLATWA